MLRDLLRDGQDDDVSTGAIGVPAPARPLVKASPRGLSRKHVLQQTRRADTRTARVLKVVADTTAIFKSTACSLAKALDGILQFHSKRSTVVHNKGISITYPTLMRIAQMPTNMAVNMMVKTVFLESCGKHCATSTRQACLCHAPCGTCAGLAEGAGRSSPSAALAHGT